MSTTSTSTCASCTVEECPSRNPGHHNHSLDPSNAGPHLASNAIITFVLPLFCTMAAAAVAPDPEGLRIGIAFAGLAVGIILARSIQRRSTNA